MATPSRGVPALALDIETASPDARPGRGEFDDTAYFELVAVGLGYRAAPDASPETTVLFRRGDWAPAWTADLLERALSWCEARPADRLVTYNGSRFDLVHLRAWADEAASAGLLPDARERLDAATAGRVDLAPVAAERFRDRLGDRYPYLPFDRACAWAGVETRPTRYDDYGIDPEVRDGWDVAGEVVEGRHVGIALGEAYVESVAAGLDGTRTFAALESLLTDYAERDVAPLFDLDAALGRPVGSGGSGGPDGSAGSDESDQHDDSDARFDGGTERGSNGDHGRCLERVWGHATGSGV